MTRAEIASTYLRLITEAIAQQSTPGQPWPEPLRLPSPINMTEALALKSWLKAAAEERGAPVPVEFWTRH